MTDTVTVESNPVQVETQSTQMGDVIEGDPRIVQMALKLLF